MARFYAADGQKTYGRSPGNRNAKKAKNRSKMSTVSDVLESNLDLYRKKGWLTDKSGTFASAEHATNFSDIKFVDLAMTSKWDTTESDPITDIKKLMSESSSSTYTFRAKPELPKLPGQRVHSTHEVSVKPLQFLVRSVYISKNGTGYATVNVNFTVPDRVTGQPLELTYFHPILDNNIQEYIAEEVGNAIRNAFDHEIREMLYLGQERFREPHPEVKQLGIKVTQTAG